MQVACILVSIYLIVLNLAYNRSSRPVFLEISQNSQENTCARVSFFNKVAGLKPATLLKKRLWHSCFPVKFAKFPRTPFLTEDLRRLLLMQ